MSRTYVVVDFVDSPRFRRDLERSMLIQLPSPWSKLRAQRLDLEQLAEQWSVLADIAIHGFVA